MTFARIRNFVIAAAALLALPAGAADRGVRLVAASIPMPDGVRLAAALYMPADLRLGGAVAPGETPPGSTTPNDYAWPGSWKFERDEAQQRSTVTWHGTASTSFPWGSFDHSEQLVYQVDDAHPAISAVMGEAESNERLADRVLSYRGHLAVISDATTSFYAYTRELLRDGVLVRTKTWREAIPRDLQ